MEDEVRPYRVWWDNAAGVARAEWAKGAVCRIEEAQGLDAGVAALGHGEVPTLVNIRHMASIDRASRDFFMETTTFSAVALLAGSAATRMMANFFLGIKRGGNPTKMFTVESEAIAWLQAQG